MTSAARAKHYAEQQRKNTEDWRAGRITYAKLIERQQAMWNRIEADPTLRKRVLAAMSDDKIIRRQT